jgi:hypothetical protein
MASQPPDIFFMRHFAWYRRVRGGYWLEYVALGWDGPFTKEELERKRKRWGGSGVLVGYEDNRWFKSSREKKDGE